MSAHAAEFVGIFSGLMAGGVFGYCVGMWHAAKIQNRK